MIKLTVNGAEVALPDSATGQALLTELGINPQTVVAELNGAVVPRAEFVERQLREGDVLELVTLVGGG